MGRLTLPVSGTVYADAQITIYTADVHPIYAPVLRPLWEAVAAGSVRILSSELDLLETLVTPFRTGNLLMQSQREALWQQSNACLVQITEPILREAARLRAAIPGLKTPDAIHAATALSHGCTLFVTNDTGFRRIPGLPLAMLDDVLAAP